MAAGNCNQLVKLFKGDSVSLGVHVHLITSTLEKCVNTYVRGEAARRGIIPASQSSSVEKQQLSFLAGYHWRILSPAFLLATMAARSENTQMPAQHEIVESAPYMVESTFEQIATAILEKLQSDDTQRVFTNASWKQLEQSLPMMAVMTNHAHGADGEVEHTLILHMLNGLYIQAVYLCVSHMAAMKSCLNQPQDLALLRVDNTLL